MASNTVRIDIRHPPHFQIQNRSSAADGNLSGAEMGIIKMGCSKLLQIIKRESGDVKNFWRFAVISINRGREERVQSSPS